jgi:mono/diheme cytochrome c family protein
MIVKAIRLALLCAGVAMVVYLTPGLRTALASGPAANDRGQKLYMEYCTSCHGADAKGNGPVASTLKTPPGDLTKITREGGKFPHARISMVIAGEVGQTEIAAHGTREMPVWGPIFRAIRPDKSTARLDVYALTRYIESLQKN